LDELTHQTPLEAHVNDVFTVPASLAGLPAISLPIDVVVDEKEGQRDLAFGGLQIVGQYWDDARLLAVATRLSTEISSRVRDWAG
jgi:aspartyl-tRNA(Asn)/glutamyl-tRNA(Gln) amidotransferase subunit A